jgi:hypothetical protein
MNRGVFAGCWHENRKWRYTRTPIGDTLELQSVMNSNSKQAESLGEPAARASSIPHVRTWKIAVRTMHLIVTYVLFGGHMLGAADSQLRLALTLAMASGIGLIFLEAYPSLQTTVQGWGVLVALKLALLAVIPFAWSYRVPILLVVVAIAAIGSHLPARYRHYSLLHGRVIKPQ